MFTLTYWWSIRPLEFPKGGKTMSDELRELVFAHAKQGAVVVMTIEGPQAIPLKDIIAQPLEGLLYDLNRSPEIVLTFFPDPKWVNDYAVCLVIKELKNALDAERAEFENLIASQEKSHGQLQLAARTRILELEKQVVDLQRELEEAKNLFRESAPLAWANGVEPEGAYEWEKKVQTFLDGRTRT